MIEQIFSVYDVKAKIYSPPIFFQQTGQVARLFADSINKEGHQYNLHPEDYNLYVLGTYNPRSGKIVAQDPELLYSGTSLHGLDESIENEESQEQHDTPIQPSTKSTNSAKLI